MKPYNDSLGVLPRSRYDLVQVKSLWLKTIAREGLNCEPKAANIPDSWGNECLDHDRRDLGSIPEYPLQYVPNIIWMQLLSIVSFPHLRTTQMYSFPDKTSKKKVSREKM